MYSTEDGHYREVSLQWNKPSNQPRLLVLNTLSNKDRLIEMAALILSFYPRHCWECEDCSIGTALKVKASISGQITKLYNAVPSHVLEGKLSKLLRFSAQAEEGFASQAITTIQKVTHFKVDPWSTSESGHLRNAVNLCDLHTLDVNR
ncbi:hypothetical protein RRG08_041465 [Elysia crispata]|uniref:Uncharacterized protein n=1 Tax=Elysia crispata TaxID=231223 RepID=A0AAE0Y3X7_9GAST|nr:hypothetical protein RRG08_041465 [Elysia crispata]